MNERRRIDRVLARKIPGVGGAFHPVLLLGVGKAGTRKSGRHGQSHGSVAEQRLPIQGDPRWVVPGQLLTHE